MVSYGVLDFYCLLRHSDEFDPNAIETSYFSAINRAACWPLSTTVVLKLH